MSTQCLNPLEQLLRLDGSSPKFHDEVSNVLSAEGYSKWAQNIEGSSMMEFVNFLDRVRRRASPFQLPLKLL